MASSPYTFWLRLRSRPSATRRSAASDAHPLDRVGVEQRELVAHPRLAASVPAHDGGEQLDLVRGRSPGADRCARGTRRACGDRCWRRARRCRAAARRTRAAPGRRPPRPCTGAVTSNRSSASFATWRAWGSAQLQRRARPSTALRRIACGSSDQSAGSWRPTASSTIPSRSAHSLIVSWSKSNSSIAVASTIDPATMRSTRRASRPSIPQAIGGLRREQLLVQREELLARDRELVQRRGGVLVAPRRDHLGQVLERAAAADRELGFERLDLARRPA